MADTLPADRIQAHCREQLGQDCYVHWFEELDSTNTWLVNRAHELISQVSDQVSDQAGAQFPIHLCIAETQTAGRGRRGKQWNSSSGDITFSLLYPLPAPRLAEIGSLSLVAACTILAVLQSYGATELAIKWPNDLLYRRRKLCGVLIESSGSSDAVSRVERQVITGIGLNYTAQPLDQACLVGRRDAHEQALTALPRADLQQVLVDPCPTRERLIGELSCALVQAYRRYTQFGFGAFRQQWQRNDFCYGRAVSLSAGQASALASSGGAGDALPAVAQALAGIARGVADDGALLLETETGLQRHYAGELSLRLPS